MRIPKLTLPLLLVLGGARAWCLDCSADERARPGFIQNFMEHFRHQATPKELNDLDREQAYARKEDVLYYIVHDKCLPAKSAGKGSGQCHVVDTEKDCAILQTPARKDYFLAIPLGRVTGIEDPSLAPRSSPNYFGCAWAHRNTLDLNVLAGPKREDLAFGINSSGARSQNQLHIHMGCVNGYLKKSLLKDDAKLGATWTDVAPNPAAQNGTRYLKVERESLEDFNPFQLLRDDLSARGQADKMAEHALLVVGATFPDGKPGFYLVDRWDSSGYAENGPTIDRDVWPCPEK